MNLRVASAIAEQAELADGDCWQAGHTSGTAVAEVCFPRWRGELGRGTPALTGGTALLEGLSDTTMSDATIKDLRGNVWSAPSMRRCPLMHPCRRKWSPCTPVGPCCGLRTGGKPKRGRQIKPITGSRAQFATSWRHCQKAFLVAVSRPLTYYNLTRTTVSSAFLLQVAKR